MTHDVGESTNDSRCRYVAHPCRPAPHALPTRTICRNPTPYLHLSLHPTILRDMHAHDPLSPLPRPFTVIILGSNLSSLSLALSLTRKNIAFTLLARSPEASFVATDGGDPPVVLHPHGVAILSQLGVWDALKPRHTPLPGGWWGAVETSFAPPPAARSCRPDRPRRLGYPFALLPRRHLLATLLARLPAACLHANTKAVDIRADAQGATVITAGMEMFCGDIVVDTEGLAAAFPVERGKYTWISGDTAVDASELIEAEGPAVAMASRRGEAAAAVTVEGKRYWWSLLRGALRQDLSSSHLSLGNTALSALWLTAASPPAVAEVEAGVSPRGNWHGARTLQLADGLYKLAPAALLAASLDLEGVAALTNAIVGGGEDYTAIFTAFEDAMRPRVETCAWVSMLATRVAVGKAWWQGVLARRMPAWVYCELAIRSILLDNSEFPLRGRFVRARRVGGVVGRVGDLGLRAKRVLRLDEAVAAARCAAADLDNRPLAKWGVRLFGAMVVAILGVRWARRIDVGWLLGRAVAVARAARGRRF